MNTAMQRQTPTRKGYSFMQVSLWDGDEEEIYVDIDVEMSFEPNEFIGSLLTDGSWEINSTLIVESFRFMGKEYMGGREFPDDLLQYVNWNPLDATRAIAADEAAKKNDVQDLNRFWIELVDSEAQSISFSRISTGPGPRV